MPDILIDFKNPYPADYFTQMDVFSRVELRRYDDNPDDKTLRLALIKKRGEFNYYQFIKRRK